MLVLDDYHLIDAAPNPHPPLGAVDQALTFLIEHLPPQMHLVITTREDPQIPLARLRARGQLTELRAADLRFTAAEAAEFLNQVMGLSLAAVDITALEERTEGWIAGLQLAALSMQDQQDVPGFIRAFAGDHRYIVDYSPEAQYEPGLTEIRLKGHLDNRWADWFDGLTITREENGDTLLTGPVIDQAALHSLLRKVRDLGLPLVSVMYIEPKQADGPAVKP